MATFTPGPWELHQEIPGGSNSVRVCVPDATAERGCRAVAEAEILRMPRLEAEANARLIAAAPELLDALRAFCGDYESCPLQIPEIHAAYHHALGVIAKAEGRS